MTSEDEQWLLSKDARVRTLEGENETLRRQLGFIADYAAKSTAPPEWMTRVGKKRNEGVALAQLSDTHFEEVVNPHELNGLNAYNREIAEQRLRRWAHKVCEMGARARKELRFSGLILLLSGDIFSGDIHDELMRTNANYLPESLVHWIPLVAAAVKQVCDGFRCPVYVDAVVGNHGRMTRKKEYKGRARNNFDFALYQLVKSHFKDQEDVTWNISQAPYSFVLLPGERFICHSHGDEEQGGNSATGGVLYPMGRIRRNGIKRGQVHKKNVAYSACGHWHTALQAQGYGFVVNGSLKGYDEFAAGHSFDPEPAQQNWWVEIPGKGTVMTRQIYVVDKKKEGW